MQFILSAVCLIAVIGAAVAKPHGPPPPNHHDHGHGEHHIHQIPPQMEAFLNDIADFQALYPMHEIRQIVRQHFKDGSLRATLQFLRTPEFQQTMMSIAESAEMEAIAVYMASADWPWLNQVFVEAIDEMEEENKDVAVVANARNMPSEGLNGLLDAIVAVLPKEQLRALFDEKMATRQTFREVVQIVTSDEIKGLIANVKNSAELRTHFVFLAENGINVQKMYQTLLAFVGF